MTADDVARRRGELIAQAIKRLPIEQKFKSPCHYRLIAAVVVFQGDRCLWIRGGTDKRERMHLEPAERASTERPHWPEWGEFWRRKAAEIREHGGELHHPWAGILPPPQGHRVYLDAPCPRCHHATRIEVEDDGTVRVAST